MSRNYLYIEARMYLVFAASVFVVAKRVERKKWGLWGPPQNHGKLLLKTWVCTLMNRPGVDGFFLRSKKDLIVMFVFNASKIFAGYIFL